MHFEFLVEGQVELTTLSIILPSLIGQYGQPHTWRVHKHRGIGSIPEDPSAPSDRNNQTLLHNLPAKLKAYGRESRTDLLVVILVDLDDRKDCKFFKSSLVGILDYCNPKPKALFRIAIEELEAWFLGDRNALIQAYPDIRTEVLVDYVQDSQCGTWEVLANAVYPGGLNALEGFGKRSVRILEQKRLWAKNICPYMDTGNNGSPSFIAFRDGLKQYLNS